MNAKNINKNIRIIISTTESNIKLGSTLNYENKHLIFKVERMLLKSNYQLKTISIFFSGRNCIK